MRLTEVIVKQGGETNSFKLPSQIGKGLLKLLRSFPKDEADFVSAEEVFPDLKDPVKRIGIIFRGIRHKHGLTQIEVADRLGLDQSDVSKIEKGRRPIGKALAKKIEKEFGIDYRRFL